MKNISSLILIISLSVSSALLSACGSKELVSAPAPAAELASISPSAIAPGGFVKISLNASDPNGGQICYRVNNGESALCDEDITFVYQASETPGTEQVNIQISNGLLDYTKNVDIQVDESLPGSSLRSGRAALPRGKSFDFFSGTVVDPYYGDMDYLYYSYYRNRLDFEGDRSGSTISGWDGGLVNLTYYDRRIKNLNQVSEKYTGSYYQSGSEREYSYDQSSLKVGDIYGFALSYTSKFFGKFKIISLDNEKIVFDWVFQKAANETKFYDYSSNLSSLNPPMPPQGLSAVSSLNSITLSWEASAENDITGYWIYRKAADEIEFQKIKNLGAVTTTTDNGLTLNTTYTYKIKAIDSAFNVSEFSDVISITTLALPAGSSPVLSDGAESGMTLWQADGFSLSSAKSHSPSYSFYSGRGNDIDHTLTLISPISIDGYENLNFYGNYSSESRYDYLYVQVSENNTTWNTLESLCGSSSGWEEKSISLSAYAGKNIYLRFLYATDYSVDYEGFYLDDISVE